MSYLFHHKTPKIRLITVCSRCLFLKTTTGYASTVCSGQQPRRTDPPKAGRKDGLKQACHTGENHTRTSRDKRNSASDSGCGCCSFVTKPQNVRSLFRSSPLSLFCKSMCDKAFPGKTQHTSLLTTTDQSVKTPTSSVVNQ